MAKFSLHKQILLEQAILEQALVAGSKVNPKLAAGKEAIQKLANQKKMYEHELTKLKAALAGNVDDPKLLKKIKKYEFMVDKLTATIKRFGFAFLKQAEHRI